jgi:hypothetical protein
MAHRGFGRAFLLAGMALVFVVLGLNSCSQTCNIPTERSPSLRIVNAMPDQSAVDILIDGRTVDPAYPYQLPALFGYYDTYADGSLLHTGYKQKLVVLSEAQDTLIDTLIALNDHRHTLVLLGKKGRKDLLKILLFDDEVDQRIATDNLLRYVDAITDLPALDVYFQSTFSGHKPDLQLHYGDSLGYDMLNGAAGLTITAAGDTNDVIFTLPYSLQSTSGFFITVVLRGEKHPTGSDPIVGTELLSDQLPGRVFYQVHSFGVRFVNATRGGLLSLEVRGPSDQGPRNNISGQTPILLTPVDTVTDWAPFNPDYHGSTATKPVTWFFASGNNLNSLSTIDSFQYKPVANVRYTMIAMDQALLGNAQVLDSMIITDTIPPPASGTARLRIVNLSPDHTITFTLAGKNFSMVRKDVEIIDVPAGVENFPIYDASKPSTALKTIQVSLPGGVPRTLFFMPDLSSQVVPAVLGLE